jgi:hypothetical protein
MRLTDAAGSASWPFQLWAHGAAPEWGFDALHDHLRAVGEVALRLRVMRTTALTARRGVRRHARPLHMEVRLADVEYACT